MVNTVGALSEAVEGVATTEREALDAGAVLQTEIQRVLLHKKVNWVIRVIRPHAWTASPNHWQWALTVGAYREQHGKLLTSR